MAVIWCEVFTITLFSHKGVLVQPVPTPVITPWILPHQAVTHPNTVVIEHLMTFFEHQIAFDKLIVHSTSWRYDQKDDQFLLTYLAVLPSGLWLEQWEQAQRLTMLSIEDLYCICGDNVAPPDYIEPKHVLAHAMDHLAALSTYDPGIQSALDPGWYPILQVRNAKVAGCLQKKSALKHEVTDYSPEVLPSR